jgi:hypothetical protein
MIILPSFTLFCLCFMSLCPFIYALLVEIPVISFDSPVSYLGSAVTCFDSPVTCLDSPVISLGFLVTFSGSTVTYAGSPAPIPGALINGVLSRKTFFNQLLGIFFYNSYWDNNFIFSFFLHYKRIIFVFQLIRLKKL